MGQTERIKAMEGRLDACRAAVTDLLTALERYAALQGELGILNDYYTGGQWLRDYEDDCAGKLPADLKRGVLSQDAVYDLLADHDRMMDLLRELSREK